MPRPWLSDTASAAAQTSQRMLQGGVSSIVFGFVPIEWKSSQIRIRLWRMRLIRHLRNRHFRRSKHHHSLGQHLGCTDFWCRKHHWPRYPLRGLHYLDGWIFWICHLHPESTIFFLVHSETVIWVPCHPQLSVSCWCCSFWIWNLHW